MMENFSPSEFTMDNRVVYDRMNRDFLVKLDALREVCGFPFRLTSSWRSPEKNKRVGGSPTSLHLQGRAVDIACTDGDKRAVIIRTALNMGLSVGIMANAIHVDDREEQIVFHYYK